MLTVSLCKDNFIETISAPPFIATELYVLIDQPQMLPTLLLGL